MGAGPLAQVLRPLTTQQSPKELLVGLSSSDDAAVYQVAPDLAIVTTLDFFPPIVDDAYASGAIGAANAMSDVYAMGGEVAFALNIAAWPELAPLEQLEMLLRGAVDKVGEGGGVVAGGHTLIDVEPKFGLSVTGHVHPGRMLLKSALTVGDEVWLTKPIGTGILATAHKRGQLAPEDLASVVASMSALNRAAAQAAMAAGVRAATDVTGFSLVGHAHEMAQRSGVAIRLRAAHVPLLPAARVWAERGAIPGGSERNRSYFVGEGLVRLEGLDRAAEDLMLDPQTSGGLLLGVPAGARDAWRDATLARDVHAALIGEVVSGSGVTVTAA